MHKRYNATTFRDKFVFAGETKEREAQRENLVQDYKLALRQWDMTHAFRLTCMRANSPRALTQTYINNSGRHARTF